MKIIISTLALSVLTLFSCKQSDSLKIFPDELKGEFVYLSDLGDDVQVKNARFIISENSILEISGVFEDEILSSVKFVTKNGDVYKIFCDSEPSKYHEAFTIEKAGNYYRIEKWSREFQGIQYFGVFSRK